jgi:hypothetical protein
LRWGKLKERGHEEYLGAGRLSLRKRAIPERTKSNRKTGHTKGRVAFKHISKKTEEEPDWIDLAQDR